MSIKLRDLIRSVRACKTAAEERAVISKECALIRTAIKEEDEQNRYRNVAKLMYIHMLGYPTHFGQMECLKLISAPSFPEKRIGYLALTLLLTENTEVLTLVTNSLKLDLTSNNQYIQALSLITIGNLATQDMARDLASDVEKLLKSSNSYLRKKASLAAIRILKKEPDLIEHMQERIAPLLKDRAHGVLITGIQLIIDVLTLIPSMKAEYEKLVPSLVRLLRNFITMGFSPEHDVSGIADPFMQVKLLRLLRMLGEGNQESSSHMHDVLSQVASNTDSSKNAGNAILYECVQTIMGIQSEAASHTIAINILGRFLLNRDNNIRYVALNSLSKVVTEDMSAVQRHRGTIVDCLKDADISIRQRALELIYQLVNDSNVVMLVSELLNYLVVAQADQKASLVSKLMQIVEKFSPTNKWRVDTVITMLSIAGNNLDDSISRTAVIFIAQAEELHAYSTHRLYRYITDDSLQQALLQVGIWCIGEYGDKLLRGVNVEETSYDAVQEHEIIALLDKCTRMHNADAALRAITLNALTKLSVRLSSSTAAIRGVLEPYKQSMSIELQQRSSEYCLLLSPQFANLRGELLGKMPVIDEAALRRRRAAFDSEGGSAFNSSSATTSMPSFASGGGGMGGAGGGGSLLDLDDVFGSNSPAKPAAAQPPRPPASNNDLLADIFSMNNMSLGSGHQQQPTHGYAPQHAGMLLQQPLQPPLSSAQAGDNVITAFEKAGIKILIEMSKPNPAQPSSTRLLCKFSNLTPFNMDNLVFQVAVPKYLKLEILPPSSTTIPSNSTGTVSQEIRLVNSVQGEKGILLKVKIGYLQNGQAVEETATVSNFPPNY